MGATPAETAAMRRALQIAATPGVPLGPNPRVGCVLLADDGTEVAEGFHRGAGSPHAEVAALDRGRRRRPRHHRRRDPRALQPHRAHRPVRRGAPGRRRTPRGLRPARPQPRAAGGADALRAAGVEVEAGVLADEAARLNRAWTFAVEHGRPFVTWKLATTLDGRSAAADGTSRWISSEPARQDTHRLRAECDVLIVGTGTVEVDDPLLTVRDDWDRPVRHQPLRAVMGLRELAPDRRILNNHAETLHLRTHEPAEALRELYDRGRQHVWLEGGPTLAAAFLTAGLVDEVIAYVAPSLLGAGTSAVGDLGITTIDDQLRFRIRQAAVIGTGADANVRLTLERTP